MAIMSGKALIIHLLLHLNRHRRLHRHLSRIEGYQRAQFQVPDHQFHLILDPGSLLHHFPHQQYFLNRSHQSFNHRYLRPSSHSLLLGRQFSALDLF